MSTREWIPVFAFLQATVTIIACWVIAWRATREMDARLKKKSENDKS